MSFLDGDTAWIGVFVLAFVKQVLNRDESWLGLMNGSFFSGSIVGGLLVVALVKRLQKRSFLFMLLGFTVYILLAGWFADQFGMTNLYLFAAFLTSIAVVVGFFNRSMTS
ncbi:hypothetical protein [Brevibacillus laterosporus]|uniref:hypothetical protein n=1 Tax=Brevibacillus laterosporus TaxID=1465 RepID=UPI0018CCC92A